MHSHPVARVTALSRERLMRRHLEGGEALTDLAAQAEYCCAEADGYSLGTACKWLARFRSGGDPSMRVNYCRPWTLRHQRCTLHRIAKALHASLSTLGRVMQRLWLGRLKNLEPKKRVVR